MSQSNPVNQIAQDLLTLQATGALTSLSSFGSAATAAAVSSVRQQSPAAATTTTITTTTAVVSSSSSATPTTQSNSGTKAEYFSETEASILRSKEPITIDSTEEITALGQRGIWANKKEVTNWKGDVPITEYFLNEDSNPEIIFKKANNKLEYVQELAIRYLRPPTPPAAGEIVITQEANVLTPPAPPLVIRQQPARPSTPEPLIVREAPPKPPPPVGRKLITISGKRLPPPPRKVVIERLAPIPAKPQAIIAERWLPYTQQKRKVIFRAAPPDPVIVKPRNIVVQWESPIVTIRKEIKNLGIVRANPNDYVARYGESLKLSEDLPQIVKDIPSPDGIVLAANYKMNPVHQLEGEIEALKLIDLDSEGLSEYRSQLLRQSAQYLSSAANSINRNSVNKSIMSLESLLSGKTSSTAGSTSTGSDSISYRHTYVSTTNNAQSSVLANSRNNSVASASQINGQLASLQSTSAVNNQLFAPSVQSLKNSSVVSGAASTVKLVNSSSTLAQSIHSLKSVGQQPTTGISVSTQVSSAQSLQSIKNILGQGISVSTQISGAPSIPSLKNASGSIAAGSDINSMTSIKTAASNKSAGQLNNNNVQSAHSLKSASAGSYVNTPAPTHLLNDQQSLKNASASSVISSNSVVSGKYTGVQSTASIGSNNYVSGTVGDYQTTNENSGSPVEEPNNASFETSNNEGNGLAPVNEQSETSIQIEIVPNGQSSSAASKSDSSIPSSGEPNQQTNNNMDGVYTLETLSSSSSMQI